MGFLSSKPLDNFQPPADKPWRAWLIWFFSSLFYFYEFCLQTSPSVMVPELMQAFKVNASALGNLSACYFYAYCIMQIPVGILLDTFGPRRLLTLACLVCATSSYIFAHTDSLLTAEIARFAMGLGSAFSIISSFKLISLWFPHRRFAMLSGLMVTFGMLGAVFGQRPLAHLVENLGWRSSMDSLAIAGFLLTIVLFFVISDGARFETYKRQHSNDFSWHALKEILQRGQTWYTAIYAGLLFAPIAAFGELWGVPYLTETYHLPRTTAASFISLIFIGFAIGSPLMGWLSEKIDKRACLLWGGFIGALISIVLLLTVHSALAAPFYLFGFGLFASNFMLAFTVAKEVNPEQYTGTAMGFLNTINNLGPSLLQPLIGLALDYKWHGALLADGTRIYSTHDYERAAILIIIDLLLAMLFLFFIKVPTKFNHDHSSTTAH